MKKKNKDPFNRVLDGFDNTVAQITSWGRDAEENETLDMLCTAIARFGERHVDDAEIDAQARMPAEILEAAAEMGLFGLTIEEQYGGAGLSMKGSCRIIEALAAIDRSLGVSIGLHAGLGLRGLNRYGGPELKQRYLPELASGKAIACFAITESEAGSDIAAVRTTAVEDGDELVIDGTKIYATNAGFASLATIVARTPGLGGSRRGHSMILVPLDKPGVTRDAEEYKLGLKGSSTRSLHFENVRVAKDHLIGTPSRGLDNLNHVLSWGRTLMAAGCIGLARTALERTLEQVTNRRQFNRAIGEFGMVRSMLAAMRSGIHAMESVIRLCTRLEDEQPESIAWESSVAKVFCSEHAWQTADDTVQLHGGSGFIEDTGVARLLRDCRITRIFEGANELLRFHMASAAFTWKQARLAEAQELAGMLEPPFKEHGQFFDELLRKFAAALAERKKKFGLKVFKRQMDQRRIADAAGALYIMLSLLARAKGESDAGKLSDEMLAWTLHGLDGQARLVEANLQGLSSNRDDLENQIAAAECARIGMPLEETVS